MADRSRPPAWLRGVTVASLLAVQLGVALAIARVTPLRLPRDAWTKEVMAAGVRSLPPAGFPQTFGMIESYRDGGIVVHTTQGLDEVRIDPDTVVVTGRGTGALEALRPGVTVAVWGRRAPLSYTVTARAILVP